MSTGKLAIYLRVGDGVYSGTYTTNGKPGSGGSINRVSVTVPATVLGNGSNLTMTSDATESRSFYDGYQFCNLPEQVYVGGGYRGNHKDGDGRSEEHTSELQSLMRSSYAVLCLK